MAETNEPSAETRLFIECSHCGGSGFAGHETGYDGVCSECGGQKMQLLNTTLKAERDVAHCRGVEETMLAVNERQQQLDDFDESIVKREEPSLAPIVRCLRSLGWRTKTAKILGQALYQQQLQCLDRYRAGYERAREDVAQWHDKQARLIDKNYKQANSRDWEHLLSCAQNHRDSAKEIRVLDPP